MGPSILLCNIVLIHTYSLFHPPQQPFLSLIIIISPNSNIIFHSLRTCFQFHRGTFLISGWNPSSSLITPTLMFQITNLVNPNSWISFFYPLPCCMHLPSLFFFSYWKPTYSFLPLSKPTFPQTWFPPQTTNSGLPLISLLDFFTKQSISTILTFHLKFIP